MTKAQIVGAEEWGDWVKATVNVMVEDGLQKWADRTEVLAKKAAPVRRRTTSKKKNRKEVSLTLMHNDKVASHRKVFNAMLKQQRKNMDIARFTKRKTERVSFSSLGISVIGEDGKLSSRAKGNIENAAFSTVNMRVRNIDTVEEFHSETGRPGKTRTVRGEVELRKTLRSRRGVFFNLNTGKFQYGGFLRESIHAGDVEKTRDGYRVEVRAFAPYAAAVEFGRKNGKRGVTQKRPFMYPAATSAYGRLSDYTGLGER